jgi:hypothetical protein
MSSLALEKNKGGRGKKASFRSVVVRVPEDLTESLSWMVLGYRYSQVGGGYIDPLPAREEIDAKVQDIVRQKISARASLALLVQWLYMEK